MNDFFILNFIALLGGFASSRENELMFLKTPFCP